jgi:hypothetical protein
MKLSQTFIVKVNVTLGGVQQLGQLFFLVFHDGGSHDRGRVQEAQNLTLAIR